VAMLQRELLLRKLSRNLHVIVGLNSLEKILVVMMSSLDKPRLVCLLNNVEKDAIA